ncbi:MAG: hypothetical protein ACM31C_15880, partial [Acidobacteriota bacterium]
SDLGYQTTVRDISVGPPSGTVTTKQPMPAAPGGDAAPTIPTPTVHAFPTPSSALTPPVAMPNIRAGSEDASTEPKPNRPRTDEARTTVTPNRERLEALYVGPPAPPRWIVLAQRYRVVVIAGAAALVLAIALVIMLVRHSSSSTPAASDAAIDAPATALAPDAGTPPDAGVADAAQKTSPKPSHPPAKHR